MNLSSQTSNTLNKKQRRGTLCLQLNPKSIIYGRWRGTRTPTNDDKKSVSSSCRRASGYTSLLWVVIWMMKINHLLGFSELFLLTRLQPFWAVLAPTILRSGVVRLLTWCRLAGFSYVVRPFARSRHPLMLSSYFFYTHTISVHQHVKELSSMSAQWNSHLTQDCRCPNDLLYKV